MKIVPLGKLTSLVSSGSTPLGGAKVYLPSGPVMLIRSQNVLMRKLNLDNVAFITDEVANNMKRTVVQPNDVLLNITGASIGRVATFELDKTEANVNQHVCIVRTIPELLNHRYLMHFIAQPRFQSQIDSTQHGGTRQALTFSKIRSFQIPLPPLDEQRRIAAILDKADGVRQKRREAIRLTEELLRSQFLEMFGDPVTNPKGWETKSLDSLLICIESGWSPKCDSREAEPEEWGVLKLGAITWGHFNSSENKALLPETDVRQELEVSLGDLLFARKNTYELVGATAFVHQTRPRLLLPDLIFRLKFSDSVDPVYVWQALSQQSMRRELSKLASGSAGSMPNISKARLRTLPIPVPAIGLQSQYRKFVEHFWRQKEHQKISLDSSDNLFNSLLQRAFRGDL